MRGYGWRVWPSAPILTGSSVGSRADQQQQRQRLGQIGPECTRGVKWPNLYFNSSIIVLQISFLR